jgi:hypothetical protein
MTDASAGWDYCRGCQTPRSWRDLLKVSEIASGEVFHVCRPTFEGGLCFGAVVSGGDVHRIEAKRMPEDVQSPAPERLGGREDMAVYGSPRGGQRSAGGELE